MTSITGNMKKQCSSCDKIKGMNGFNRQAASKDGFKALEVVVR